MTNQEQHSLTESGRTRDHYSFDFEEVATSVEERFRRAYTAEGIGDAKAESQMEYDTISMGWWLVIKRLGLALWVGNDKPALDTGDLLEISIKKKDIE